MIIMPFGQHKGLAIGDPKMHWTYYRWLVEAKDPRVTTEMREAATLELAWPETLRQIHHIEDGRQIVVEDAYTGLEPRLFAALLATVPNPAYREETDR